MTAAWQPEIDRQVEDLPHEFGVVDDCIRCVHCEVLPHRAVGGCSARISIKWVKCWACTTSRCSGQGCIDGWFPRVVERGSA